MEKLRENTGESIQLYEVTGNTRTCIATREPESGLHNVVPVGRQLPLSSGSAARIIAAYIEVNIEDASFTLQDIEAARSQGYSESIEEREAGLASISAPVFDEAGTFLAVLSISGSVERFQPSPAQKYADTLTAAARELSSQL